MAKSFIKISDVSNEEAERMFSAICSDVIKQDEQEVKEMLGIPKSTPVTTKDLISLIQDSNVKCDIIVWYDSETTIEAVKVEAPVAEAAKEKAPAETGGEELPF